MKGLEMEALEFRTITLGRVFLWSSQKGRILALKAPKAMQGVSRSHD